ncbi:MAG TPA: glutamine synthetase type III, partial [Clostridia bacterium]|nr:glutamine synthetase type III [Clostridia bacterium]
NHHNLTCLLHEKPFAGVNGSGKHNNWSLSTDDGTNLLEPGSTPESNRVFLLFLLAVIGGVDEYQDLLRMSTASAGNDLRIGAHEAPPAIISVYVGNALVDMFENLENGAQGIKRIREYLKMGVPNTPRLKKDVSDRNRTSPFAFTGNKFEFRMVGSSQTLATANIVLNTITAEMLRRISDEIEYAVSHDEDSDFEHIISTVILKYIKKYRRIIFNGNNYSKEWQIEAEKRGLINLTNCVDALNAMLRPEVIQMLERNGVLTEKEVICRHEIYLEDYSKTLHIEALTALSIAKTQLLPAIMRYEGKLAVANDSLKKLGDFGSVQLKAVQKIDSLLIIMNERIADLETATEKSSATDEVREKAVSYRDLVVPAINCLREVVDKLQLICDKSVWPYPNYEDLLFYE